MSFYKTKLTLGKPVSRNLELGIQMSPLVAIPEAPPPVVPEPCVLPLLIYISDEYLSSIDPPPWINIHTVTLLNRTLGDTDFVFSLVQLDIGGAPLTLGPLVASDGVVISTDEPPPWEGTIHIPDGVTSFTITVDDSAEVLEWVKYQLQISNVFGTGVFQTY